MTPKDEAQLAIIEHNIRQILSCNDAIDRGYGDWADENRPRFEAEIKDAIAKLSKSLQGKPAFRAWKKNRGDTRATEQTINRLSATKQDNAHLTTIQEALSSVADNPKAEEEAMARAHEAYLETSAKTRRKLTGVDLWCLGKGDISLARNDLSREFGIDV